jgi:hypothetical protein
MKALLLSVVLLLVIVVGGVVITNTVLTSSSGSGHSVRGTVRAVVVRSDRGDVRLVAGTDRVFVRESRTYVFKEPTLDEHLEHGVLTLQTHCDGVVFTCSIDLELRLPPGVKVTVDSDSGDVEAQGVAVRNPHVQSDSGDVSLDLTGRQALVWAHADSGDVDVVARRAGAVDARTDSGNVDVAAGRAPRRIVAKTDSGDVDVTVPPGEYAVKTSTDSGDVDVDAGIVRNDRAPRSIDAQTDSGDVRLQAR